jgi:hypothetical protein
MNSKQYSMTLNKQQYMSTKEDIKLTIYQSNNTIKDIINIKKELWLIYTDKLKLTNIVLLASYFNNIPIISVFGYKENMKMLIYIINLNTIDYTKNYKQMKQLINLSEYINSSNKDSNYNFV